MSAVHKRIGLMVPAANTVMEFEYGRAAPKEVSVHASRFELGGMTAQGLEAMREEFSHCAALLRQCSDVAVLGILSGTIESDHALREIEEGIRSAYGGPVITVARALLHVINAVEPKAVHLISPYSQGIAESQASFLKRNGAPVKGFSALGYSSSLDAARLPRERIYDLISSTARDVDLTLLTCTNVYTFDTIKQVYREERRLAVSSNLAGLWLALDTLNLPFCLKGFLESD